MFGDLQSDYYFKLKNILNIFKINNSLFDTAKKILMTIKSLEEKDAWLQDLPRGRSCRVL